jgi:hypothetical protein
MGMNREKFSSQAKSEILAAMRELARNEGRQFQSVLEEAMQDYLQRKLEEKPRKAVMAHFRAGLERNRELGKLLAQ